MHELTIARELIRVAEREIERAGGVRAIALTVEVGALSGVVPEALASAFEIARRGTPLEGAELELRRLPVRIRCDACDAEGEPTDPVRLRCPRCGGRASRVVGGDELRMVELELQEGGSGASSAEEES